MEDQTENSVPVIIGPVADDPSIICINLGRQMSWFTLPPAEAAVMGVTLLKHARTAAAHQGARIKIGVGAEAICDFLGFDIANHHNAAECPYCQSHIAE